MKSLILKTAILILIPIFGLFSLYLLFRGHDYSGGGFIGALTISIIIVFHAMIFGSHPTIQRFRLNSMFLIATGLLLAAASGMASLLTKDPYLSAIWFQLPVIGKMGTPIFFDIGVYTVVIGIVLKITFSLIEEKKA